MLARLSIRDVVLIDRLELVFRHGLCVLTGETGAGKSILLDALGLAMGYRAEARLVRHGCEQAQVTAEFDLSPDHAAYVMLAAQDIECAGEPILLRRVLGNDGRSRAYVNDQPISIGLLKALGAELVEIHGQFDNQKLMNPASHLGLLDAHGKYAAKLNKTGETFDGWHEARSALNEARAAFEAARQDEEYLRHAVDELDRMAPQPGEEAKLAEDRTLMMHGEKLIEAMNKANKVLGERAGVERMMRDALRALEPVADKADGVLDESMQALDAALDQVATVTDSLSRAAGRIDLNPSSLEQVEERLFQLRAIARKHDVAVDALAALADRLRADLAALDDGGVRLEALAKAELQAKARFTDAAEALSKARLAAAKGMDKAVAVELTPLKMGQAKFITAVETHRDDETQWSKTGFDKVRFEVATNPGQPAGPLNKIASGGEMARFMLALKVVLAEADPVPTLIFDEVDAGIGGAVADAVGQRLSKLGRAVQVLVVTHSPQVAARGVEHLRVSKQDTDKSVSTTVEMLDASARADEIARMLAGESVTAEARAAAESLLAGAAQ